MAQGSGNYNILSNIISGKVDGDNQQQIYSNGTGQLSVELGGSNVSAFGDIITAENTPVVQLDFIYGINTQVGTTGGTSTGIVDTSAGRLRLQTGTGSAATASFNSRRPAKYRAGQGMTARFTPIWSSSGATNSIQLMGVGNAVDGYFYGFSGTSFGIVHRNNSVDTFIPQSSWNGDRVDGSGNNTYNLSNLNWDKTKGTPIMIRYPFLGYGTIKFYYEAPTGAWINTHTIAYPNSSQNIQITNPTLFFYSELKNTGNTSNLTMYCGSVGIFISGVRSFIGNPKWGIDNNKSAITTETNILTLKNATTYNTTTNRGLIRLLSMSVASDGGNGISTFRIKINPTVGGTPSFTPINGSTSDSGTTITNANSMASYDTAGTTIGGGMLIFNSTCSRNSSTFIDLAPYEIFIAPGEIASFTAFGAVSTTASIAINWSEDL